MWRNVSDLFRAAFRRHNILKPDARLNSEECSKQVCGSADSSFFPIEKAVEKCKHHVNDNYKKKERCDEQGEKFKDCRPKWESSWVGAIGWSSALVLGWYMTQPICRRRFLHRRGDSHGCFERLKCCSLLDVVSRYALSQPSESPRLTLQPVTVGTEDRAIAYGPITAEQAVDEAAEKFADAQNQIMGAVENNKGVQLMKAGEPKKAVAFFKRASSFQNARAAYNLGICYEKGMGISRSLEEAARWYELASSRGHAGAMYNLGVFYAQGLGELTKDRHRARQLFETAAELGQPDAARALEKIKRLSKFRGYHRDIRTFYKALGVDVPATLKESGDVDLRSLRVSEAVVQALGLGGVQSEMLDLTFDGRKTSGSFHRRCPFSKRGKDLSTGGSGIVQSGSSCKSEVSDHLPSTVHANLIRV